MTAPISARTTSERRCSAAAGVASAARKRSGSAIRRPPRHEAVDAEVRQKFGRRRAKDHHWGKQKLNNVINGGKNDLRRNAWPANLRGEAALLVSLRSKQKSATVACPFLTE